MKNLSKKNIWLLISAVLVIVVGVAALIMLVLSPSVEVACVNSDDCRQMGVMGGVVFSFSKPVDAVQYEALMTVEGATVGSSWVWLDQHNVRWMASAALVPGSTVTFSLEKGQLGQSGERLRKTLTWEIEVRPPEIAVLGESGEGYEVFVLDESGTPVPLTQTGGGVQSFEPSPDGEQLVLTVENDRGGVDLWLAGRYGSDQRVAADCGEERCHSPAWSPDSTALLYVRSANASPEGGGSVWVKDLRSGTDQVAAEVQAVNATQPRWSPDGKWISYVVLDDIFLVQLETGETVQLTSSDGSAGCWTANGSCYVYTATLADEFGIRNVVLRWQAQDGSLSCLCDAVSVEDFTNLDRPVCHPLENLVAIRLQPNLRISGYQLTLVDLVDNSDRLIASDFTRIYSQLSWSPSGDRLLFQAFQLGGGGDGADIWLWQSDSSELQQVASGYFSPRWLP
jgi:WD40 repeat protein